MGCSCDTPATHWKQQNEPRQGCSYTLERDRGGVCRRAKTGRFGSLAFAMKNRHFGGECSWILAGKARKCGRFWVFACLQILVNKPFGDSVLQVLGNKARKNCQIVPVLPVYGGDVAPAPLSGPAQILQMCLENDPFGEGVGMYGLGLRMPWPRKSANRR